ncbi:MAG TPA: metallophosphoesterase [Acidobacteriaceae bacterium]|nr:metallophosphoesterase [Acidobacteriaceae bacterium]
MSKNAKHHYKSNRIARHSNIPLIGRSPLMAHMQSSLAESGHIGRYPLLAIFVQRPWPWIRKYIRGIFTGRYKPFPTYPLDGHSGIYPLHSAKGHDPIRLSIAGDWGTGTEEAARIATNMADFHPDYTIHLGDVYYIGDEVEVEENFLGIQCTGQTPVRFPRGAVGTLTMPGNHELYAGGRPYYTKVLPFGSPTPGQQQRASYFCLESDHWRIIGLDTGYNSAGVPILGSVPGLRSIKAIGGDGRLEPSEIDWLRTNVRPQERPKATILLSHHQYYSAFPDETFPKPGQQLAEFFPNQDVLWLWGHEHRLAVYDLHAPPDTPALSCFGRCIGHGGMPVEKTPPKFKEVPLRFYDSRNDYPIGNGDTAGWNGYANLTISGPHLTIDYLDIEKRRLYTETFTSTPSGSVQLTEPTHAHSNTPVRGNTPAPTGAPSS